MPLGKFKTKAKPAPPNAPSSLKLAVEDAFIECGKEIIGCLEHEYEKFIEEEDSVISSGSEISDSDSSYDSQVSSDSGYDSDDHPELSIEEKAAHKKMEEKGKVKLHRLEFEGAMAFAVGDLEPETEKEIKRRKRNKTPKGKLIDGETFQVVCTYFRPTKKELDSGQYWLDHQQGFKPIWYYYAAGPGDWYVNNVDPVAPLIHATTRGIMSTKFVPTKKQLSQGLFWLDVHPNTGAKTWYYLPEGMGGWD